MGDKIVWYKKVVHFYWWRLLLLTHKDCTPISMCMQWDFKLWPDGRCSHFEHGRCYFSLTCRCVSVPGTAPILTTMWKETWPSTSAVISTDRSLLLTMLTSTWMTHSHREKLSTTSLPQIWTTWDWLCCFLVYEHGACVCACMCVCVHVCVCMCVCVHVCVCTCMHVCMLWVMKVIFVYMAICQLFFSFNF